MKNKDSVTSCNLQYLDREYMLFKSLTGDLCCSLERISIFFEQLSEEQKSITLKEIENTQENICTVNNLLSYKGGVNQLKEAK